MPDPTPFAPVALGPEVSPLMLSHELLGLAERADRAGLSRSATKLLELAHTVCTERPARVASRGRCRSMM